MMEEAFAGRDYDAKTANVHLVSNVKVSFEGNRATGFSRWTVVSRNENNEPFVRLTGRYDDVYVREEGRWKFLSRTARREIP